MLNRDFLSGHYQKTIHSLLDEKKLRAPSEIPGLVGSLCFSGRLLEAKTIYKESKNELNSTEKSACRFFIGLGLTRKSKYKNASKIFQVNLKSLHKNSDSLQRFYVYQGVAFYLFFIGKFPLSMKWALKSFDAAMDAGDIYARSLSTDLLAHIKLRLGEINVGIDLLKEAEKLSRKVGNKSVTEAIEIARLQYIAQFGYNRETIITELEQKLDLLVTEDNYSRAAIGLELARQYTLRGRYDLSEKLLERISSNIFATENRRQEIQLNLRFAENYYQKGKTAQAWNYLRSAKRCLNFEADNNFEVQINELENKLFGDRAHEESYSNEDLYHNFLQSLEGSDKVSKIIEADYLSLLPEIVGVRRGEDTLFFDRKSNQIILFFEDKIEIPSAHLTPTDSKILLSLLGGIHSKEELCKKVWGYDYDQLRHDTIIYTAIRSLRKSLGNAGSWLETSEEGYHLSRDIKLKIKENAQEEVAQDVIFLESLDSYSEELNFRQMKSLQFLKNNEFLDVANYQKLFKVSDVTASRDLRTLKKLGFVVSIGKARAIKYLLATK